MLMLHFSRTSKSCFISETLCLWSTLYEPLWWPRMPTFLESHLRGHDHYQPPARAPFYKPLCYAVLMLYFLRTSNSCFITHTLCLWSLFYKPNWWPRMLTFLESRLRGHDHYQPYARAPFHKPLCYAMLMLHFPAGEKEVRRSPEAWEVGRSGGVRESIRL